MKTSIKMILALALALTMICSLGAAAFADAPLTTTVLKNPTDAFHYVGETATFVADAMNYNSLEWRFIAPNGTNCDLDAFKTQFPGSGVIGQGTTTLQITNVQTGMNGWEVFCCFTLGNDCCTTTCATISVSVPTAPAPVTTTVVTDPVYVPSTVYYEYEPDYVIVDGARVYSDGTVVYDDTTTPIYIDNDGTNYYTDGTTITPDYVPGYYWVNGDLVYGG